MTKTEEVTEKVNASENQPEESGSENTENPEITPEEKSEDISKDYLEGEGQQEDNTDWKKRYSDSTREFQSLADEKKKLEQALDNLEQLAQKNPKIQAEIEAALNLGQVPTQSADFTSQINQAIEPIKKIATNLQQNELKTRAKTFEAFEKKNPKLFPANATAEQKQDIRKKIIRIANTLEKEGMELNDAISRAHLVINPQSAIDQGKNEAYLETQGEGMASFSSQTSSEGKKPKGVKYTKEQLEAAKKLGPQVYEAMINE